MKAGGRDWSDGATSREMPGATRSWKGTDSPLESWERTQPYQHLDFGILISRTVRE